MATKKIDYVQDFLDRIKDEKSRARYEDYLNGMKNRKGESLREKVCEAFNELPWPVIEAAYGRTAGDFIAKMDMEAVVYGRQTKNYYDEIHILPDGRKVNYRELKTIREQNPGLRTIGVINDGHSYVFGKNFDKSLCLKAYPAPPKPFSPRDKVYAMGAEVSQELKDNLFRYGEGCGLHNVINPDTGENNAYLLRLNKTTGEVEATSTKYLAMMFKDENGAVRDMSCMGHVITGSERNILLQGRPVTINCTTEAHPDGFNTKVILTPGDRFQISLLNERDEYKDYLKFKENKEAKAEAKAETKKAEVKNDMAAPDQVPTSGLKLQ